MKIISAKAIKGGQRVVVEVSDDETMLLSLAPNTFYQLGGQVDDIVASHVLMEMQEVSWCSISQKWERS